MNKPNPKKEKKCKGNHEQKEDLEKSQILSHKSQSIYENTKRKSEGDYEHNEALSKSIEINELLGEEKDQQENLGDGSKHKKHDQSTDNELIESGKNKHLIQKITSQTENQMLESIDLQDSQPPINQQSLIIARYEKNSKEQLEKISIQQNRKSMRNQIERIRQNNEFNPFANLDEFDNLPQQSILSTNVNNRQNKIDSIKVGEIFSRDTNNNNVYQGGYQEQEATFQRKDSMNMMDPITQAFRQSFGNVQSPRVGEFPAQSNNFLQLPMNSQPMNPHLSQAPHMISQYQNMYFPQLQNMSTHPQMGSTFQQPPTPQNLGHIQYSHTFCPQMSQPLPQMQSEPYRQHPSQNYFPPYVPHENTNELRFLREEIGMLRSLIQEERSQKLHQRFRSETRDHERDRIHIQEQQMLNKTCLQLKSMMEEQKKLHENHIKQIESTFIQRIQKLEEQQDILSTQNYQLRQSLSLIQGSSTDRHDDSRLLKREKSMKTDRMSSKRKNGNLPIYEVDKHDKSSETSKPNTGRSRKDADHKSIARKQSSKVKFSFDKKYQTYQTVPVGLKKKLNC